MSCESCRILVIEDDADQRHLVASILEASGHQVLTADSMAQAVEVLTATASATATAPKHRPVGSTKIDLVLSDWQLPDGNGTQILELVRSDHAETAFVMVTAYGTIARAVEAIRLGADDYLAKPFERQALLLAIDKALLTRRLADENRRLSAELGERDRLVDLVGRAPSMQRLFRQVEKLAGTDATVLLVGESGTGKELAARALHALSRRCESRFLAVNCAAIPESLAEAEFFGVEKGAFTGADRSRAGVLEQADGGTLFLDEVGELPLTLQPKLLRALQEGTFSRIGQTRERHTDARVIAATNRDLMAEVHEGRFREDLYYRLNVVPLRMPPLRERREDIPRLMEHFAEQAGRRHGLPVRPFPAGITKYLLDHPWPGNVRELGHAVERLVLLADDGHMSSDDLPRDVTHPGPQDGRFALPVGGLSWDDLEHSCLSQALGQADGNRAQAARLLRLPYKAFLYRLEKHGLGS